MRFVVSSSRSTPLCDVWAVVAAVAAEAATVDWVAAFCDWTPMFDTKADQAASGPFLNVPFRDSPSATEPSWEVGELLRPMSAAERTATDRFPATGAPAMVKNGPPGVPDGVKPPCRAVLTVSASFVATSL